MTYDDLDTEIRDVEQADERQRQLLARLLDRFSDLRGRVLAIKAEMGYAEDGDGSRRKLPSFTTTHTLSWISQNVRMGSQMPFMESSIDPETGRIIINESNAEQLRQRAPDWTRQPAMTAYLAHDKKRKFASLLAVVSPSWVDNPEHENWDSEGRALKSAIQFEALDSLGKVGLVNLEDVHIYALDGQHRVMAIHGINELQEGGLTYKNRDGTPARDKRISRDEFLQKFGMDISELQDLLNEKLVVEYLPAVIAGETRVEATQRIRDVFVNINQYAMRPDKGENILLDESNGFAIVARKLATSHKIFKAPNGESRVNWKSSTITQASTSLTTLQTIKEMTESFLRETDPQRAEQWRPQFKGQVPIRPTEEDIEQVMAKFDELFGRWQRLPVMKSVDSGDDIVTLRQFSTDKNPDGGGHLLLRPFGQERMMSAIGRVLEDGQGLDSIFQKIEKFDRNGGFNVQSPSSIWYSVTFDPNKKAMITRQKDLTRRIFVYLLEGARQDERTELFNEIVISRSIDDEYWVSFNGEILKRSEANADQLPSPIAM